MSDSKQTSTAARLASYVVSNALMCVMIYFGATGTEWTARVAAFLVWFGAASHAAVAYAVTQPDEGEIRDWLARTRPFSLRDFDGAVDLAYVVVFVALGWWWTMVGAMCMLFAGASTRNTMEKAKKQEGGANAS